MRAAGNGAPRDHATAGADSPTLQPGKLYLVPPRKNAIAGELEELWASRPIGDPAPHPGAARCQTPLHPRRFVGPTALWRWG